MLPNKVSYVKANSINGNIYNIYRVDKDNKML